MKYAELGTSSEYQPYKIGHQYKVAVKNLFSRYDSIVHSLDRLFHIGHQERIVEVVKTRTEKRACLLEGTHSPLDQELRKNGIHSKFRRKLPDGLRFSTFA